MDKVKVNQEVFDALNEWFAEGKNKEDLLLDLGAALSQRYGWMNAYGGAYAGINELEMMDLAEILVKGYELADI